MMTNKYKRDEKTGALLSNNAAALAEHKARKAQRKKINTLERMQQNIDQRLANIENSVDELRALLIQALNK